VEKGTRAQGRKRRAVTAAPDEGPGAAAALQPGALGMEGALGRPARRRIAEALASWPEGATVAALADLLGVHTNAVRKQLAALQAAGIVASEPEAPSGRGRPSTRWRLVAGAGDAVAEGHHELVRLLVGLVRSSGFGADAVEAFGRDEGRLIGGPGGARALADAFARLGFAPEELASAAARKGGESDLRLNACPFRDAVLQPGGEVVCRLHRGLAAGLAERAAEGGELIGFDDVDPVRGGCRVRARGLGAPGRAQAAGPTSDA
jgi:predicted ArsR family transcriptional regulator